MTKKIITCALLSASLAGVAQMNWNTGLNNFSGGGSPNFGTLSNHPVKFFTNSIQRMSLETDGSLKINALAGAGDGDHLLVVDANGYLKQAGAGTVYNCSSTLIPWYGDGNKNMGAFNTIGTCDNTDFILKANNIKLMCIKANNSGGPYAVGIGKDNLSPVGLLDVSDGGTNSFGTNATRLYGDNAGSIETYGTKMTLISWGGLSYQSGVKGSSSEVFSIDNSGNTAMANADMAGRLKITAGTSGYASYITNATDGDVQAIWTNGQAAFGKITGAPSQAQLNVNVPSGTSNAFDIYDIASSKVTFRVLPSGKTRLGDQPGATNAAQLNVNLNGSSVDAIAVWDQSANSGSGAVNFKVKANGYTYCRELQVMTGAFPDYVFDQSYKLLPLSQLKTYIAANHHLPGFENAEYYEKNGIKTSEMFVKQQEKIEELTLYIMELEKRLNILENK